LKVTIAPLATLRSSSSDRPARYRRGNEGGFYDRTRLFLTLDELTKLRWMIVQAKERVDEIK
jgi:hypothetical protein